MSVIDPLKSLAAIEPSLEEMEDEKAVDLILDIQDMSIDVKFKPMVDHQSSMSQCHHRCQSLPF